MCFLGIFIGILMKYFGMVKSFLDIFKEILKRNVFHFLLLKRNLIIQSYI